jgi:hypothetical protein
MDSLVSSKWLAAKGWHLLPFCQPGIPLDPGRTAVLCVQFLYFEWPSCTGGYCGQGKTEHTGRAQHVLDTAHKHWVD